MRYRYIAYKYMGKVSPDVTMKSLWESFGSWAVPSPTTMWRPPTDVYETPDEIIVVVELAGVKEDDLTVTLFSDLLVVEGKRIQPMHTAMNACHQLGIKYGDFKSEIYIPYAVDHEKVTAEYKNGLLKITLKKAE